MLIFSDKFNSHAFAPVKLDVAGNIRVSISQPTYINQCRIGNIVCFHLLNTEIGGSFGI